MPISPYLGDQKFDPETKRILGVVFEMACAAIRDTDMLDELKPAIASVIIDLAKAGERDINRLCELTSIATRAAIDNRQHRTVPDLGTDAPAPALQQKPGLDEIF